MSVGTASAQRLEFRLFGAPSLSVGETRIALRRRQPLAILAVLALNDHPITRDELCYLLWPDAPQEVARQRLRRSLSELRRSLGAVSERLFVQAHASSTVLQLNVECCRIDAREFLQLLNRAQRLPDPHGLRAAEQAAQLSTEPLLQGFELSDAPEFEHWLLQQREQFAHLRLSALQRMVRSYVTLKDYPRAIATIEEALKLDALSEDLHRKAIWLYAAMGRRSDVVRQYGLCVSLLERELAVEPDPLTHMVYRAVLQGRLDEAQALAFRHELEHEAKNDISAAPIRSTPSYPRLSDLAPPPAELERRLSEAIQRALEGNTAVIWLQGPAGAGKNALAHRALARVHEARPEALRWVVSARSVRSAPLSMMQALLDIALRDWLSRAPFASTAETSEHDPHMTEAVRLLPELRAAFSHLLPHGEANTTETASSAVLQRRLLQALPRALLALTHERPAVIVMNDLEAADPLSLKAVAWLADRLVGAPAALVCTLREEARAQNPRLQALWEHLHTKQRVELLQLTPPDEATLAKLLEQWRVHASLLLEALRQHPEFSPRVALELLRATLILSREGQMRCPTSLQEALHINLRALDPVTRQVLEAAAVLGGETAHTLQLVSGRSEEEVERACETLIQWDWFDLTGSRYYITSPEIEQAVLQALSPARRQRLHQQAAAVLRQHNAEPHLIAYHLEAAGQHDEAAAMWLQASQRARELYANEAALNAAQRGLALTSDCALQFALLCAQEDILHESAQREKQADILDSLQQLSEATHNHPEWQAEVYRRRGRYALAREAWHEAVEMLQRAASCSLYTDAAILIMLARALARSQRWEEAETTLQQALALAKQHRDSTLQVQAWLLSAEMEQWRERFEAAEAALQQAIRVAGARSPLLPNLMLALGNVAALRNRFSEALTHAREAARLFARRGMPDAEAAAQVLVARMCARLGCWEEALVAYQAAYAGYAALELRQGMAAARVNASALALRMGDFETGWALAHEAYSLFETLQDVRGLCVAASNLGAALVWMGRGAEGERWLQESYARALAANLPAQQAAALANLGAALLQQGKLEAARQRMEEGLALRAAQGHLDTSIDRAFLAIACLRLSDFAAADAHSAHAVADLSRLPQAENPQQVWFARAQVLHALGRFEEAQAALQEAVALLQRVESSLPVEQRQRFRTAFPFNRAIMRAHTEGIWPNPPMLV
ncbi:MAG: tetratricopeptide repeat protein [Anaerolineae bacterium]|nr:tetratricopeptide repeat protein [Anaerolineae bacterium]